MAKIQSVWALDVGQAAMKALKLVPGETPDHVVAEAFDFIEYPKILSQPDADPEELVREAMTTFLERNEVKGSRVAISVPGQTGLVKFIKLPPVEKKRVPDIVKFEARQQIPFALEEVIWDWQAIATEGDDDEFSQTEVGLFAMKREQIQRAILPFSVAGIEVDIVQMSPIALFNFIVYDRLRSFDALEDEEAEAEAEASEAEAEEAEGKGKKGKTKTKTKTKAKPKPGATRIKSDGSMVLIDIGADNTDLIITDGQRIWQRNVPIGGNHFTRALTKELKQTFAKAEHLKRNATKAPDPRAVFTAMRGVFKDFASEINRSIGFYGSVNRQARVTRVIGMGNGFKLPGLQKFLQQELNLEVERLEQFERLVGEEVTSAPQFQENLTSFAVSYGLGLQGLDDGELKTNLLPFEIRQTRLVREKKPWTLLAAALLILGFAALFLGNYRALAKVDNERFAEAVKQAQNVKQTGDRYKSDYNSAVGKFEGIKTTGEKLVETTPDGADFKELFRLLSFLIYDPSVDPEFRDLNFDDPVDRQTLEKLRVHIDAIRPVYKTDLTAWFNSAELGPRAKDTMHPYDRQNPPEGSGWVIEIYGHHYNPYEGDRKSGPIFFLTERVLPWMRGVNARLEGFTHAALAWYQLEPKWTSEMALENPGPNPNAPRLTHSGPPASAAGAAGASGGQEEMMGGMMEGQMAGMTAGQQAMGDAAGQEEMMMGMMGMMGQGGRGFGGGRSTADAEENMTYLTRTDFVIYLVWKPQEEELKPEERSQKREELLAQLEQAAQEAGVTEINAEFIREFTLESQQQTQRAFQEAAATIQGQESAAGDGAASEPGANANQPSGPGSSP